MKAARLLLALAAFAPLPSAAADIRLLRMSNPAVMVIVVDGELHEDDGEVFATMARQVAHPVVSFNSPGGALIAGLQIGQLIRLHRYPTFVPEHALCASACALAWVAGTPRFMQAGAHIGFHAAFNMSNHEVTGAGNALVGAYLNRLGLSDDAIWFAAKAAPDDISWLTEREARRIGLELRIVPAFLSAPAPPAPREQPPAAAPSVPDAAPATIADRSKAFVAAYFAHWSETADQALTFFSGAYGPRVNLYGSMVAHAELMQQKRNYTVRWPVRVYASRPDLIQVSCGADRSCVVTGVVDWDCRNPERKARSAGSANFSLTLALADGREQIVAEAGSVISRTVE